MCYILDGLVKFGSGPTRDDRPPASAGGARVRGRGAGASGGSCERRTSRQE